MNFLSHILSYKSKVRSYRDLPLRYFELGNVTRNEKSGVIHGLLRTRQFTQDDAHIFCRPDQLIDEITAIIDMVAEVMAVFGFSYDMEISTRPEQSMGSEEMWDMATQALKDALDKKGLPYDINEGDGAFYGPKIDVKIKDAIGRSWQCATIQCDFNLPERFDIHYIGSDGERHRPVMLHRVILGSIERFIGVLIEHFAGAFPVWISPVQAVVMNITDAQADYAADVASRLRASDVRIELDTRNEKIGYKIREARQQKVPYMLITGDREKDEGTVTVREGNNTTADSLRGQIRRVRFDQPQLLRKEGSKLYSAPNGVTAIAAGAPLLLEVNVRNLVRPCTWTAPLRGLRLLARRIRGLLGTGYDVGLHAGEQLVVGVCDEVGLAEFEGFAERGLAELAAVQEDERVFAVVVNNALLRCFSDVERVDAGLGAAAAGTDERFVKVQLAEQSLREGAGDRSDAGDPVTGKDGDPQPVPRCHSEDLGVRGDHVDPPMPQ